MSEEPHQRLKRSLSLFASFVAPESALYGRLTEGMLTDVALLDLVAHSAPGQPPANMILAAVHYLLLRGADHRLAAFYPTVSGGDAPDGDPYPPFRDFCMQHRGEVESLLESRRVQTNEPQRAAILLPAFEAVARRHRAPLATLEVGTSAGLLTLWDHYGYDFGPAGSFGPAEAPLVLEAKVRGPAPLGLPDKSWSAGIDTHPIDLRDDSAALWLRALVWPDQPERMRRLEAAIAIARDHPPRLVAGDGIEVLEETAAEAPSDAILVVHHSFALNQVTEEQRGRFEAAVVVLGDSRPVVLVSVEDWGWNTDEPFRLHVGEIAAGRLDKLEVAVVHHHGEWLEWRSAVS